MSKVLNFVGGAGGESATIFVTGLDENSTVTSVSPSGKTTNGQYKETTSVNPDYLNLPNGYTQLDYIESSGTQGINTGITLTNQSSNIEFSIIWKRMDTTVSRTVLGNYNSNNTRSGGLFNITSSTTCVAIGSGNYLTSNSPTSDFSKWTITIDGANKRLTLDIDGVSKATTYSGSIITGSPIYLFCGYIDNGALEFSSDRIKRFSYKINGELVCDLIPAIQDSSNTVGMYDLAKSKFADKVNTNAFSSGNLAPHYITKQSHELLAKEYGTYTVTAKKESKNLLEPTLKKATNNGITCTRNADGTYTLNGTATGNAMFSLFNDDFESGSYKLLGCPSGGSLSTYKLRFLDKSNVAIGEDFGNGITANLQNGINIRLVVYSGMTVSDLVFKPMITADTSLTYADYEPYFEPKTTTQEVLIDMATEFDIEMEYITFLYNQGDENQSLTGGWIADCSLYNSSYTSQGTAAKSSNRLLLNNIATSPKGTSGYWAKKGFRTTEKIDVTNYSKLSITGDYYINNASGGLLMAMLLSASSSDSSNSTDITSSVFKGILVSDNGTEYVPVNTVVTNTTITFDISSITGEYYLYLYFSVGDRSGSSGYVYADSIWLE